MIYDLLHWCITYEKDFTGVVLGKIFKCGRENTARGCAELGSLESQKSRLFHRQPAQLIKSRGKYENKYLIKNSRGKETVLTKINKNSKERNLYGKCPLQTLKVIEIHWEMIETNIEKYRDQAT